MQFITTDQRIAVENFQIGLIYTVTFIGGRYFSGACIGKGADFVMFQRTAPDLVYCLNMATVTDVESIEQNSGGGGTLNYNDLYNKPQINGIELVGNKSLDNLGIQAKLTFDSAPTEDSENPVQSGGVYSALDQKQNALSSTQLSAVNSGITSDDVAQITTNKNNILSAYGGIVGKNVAQVNNFTATLNKTVYCNPITGRIHISAASISSTDTDSTICRFILYYTDGTDSSTNYSFSRGSNISLDINIGSKIIERIVIYSSDNYSHSTGDTITVSDLMICTQADYAADPTYQPYVMTNAEITAWILAHS